MPDGGKGADHRVCCADVFPVLGREVVERQQIGAVLGQAFDRPVVFHAVSLEEEIERGIGFGLEIGRASCRERGSVLV